MGKKHKVVFFDIDDTLFLSSLSSDVIYTGGSGERWRAFMEVLILNGFKIGCITNKDRAIRVKGKEYKPNIAHGLPEQSPAYMKIRYDDLCQRLLGYDEQNDSLVDLLTPELIYFMDLGREGTKTQAIHHAKTRIFQDEISPENMWLIDNEIVFKQDIEDAGYRFILVPSEMYDTSAATFHGAALEKACIYFMLQTLRTLQINIDLYPRYFNKITARSYPDKKASVCNSIMACVNQLFFTKKPKSDEDDGELVENKAFDMV